jgi:ABC transport system ATP-binding/permease protein
VLGTVGKVPLIAEFMVSRWAYESLMVNQFVNNRYQQKYYKYEKETTNATYKQIYYYPELKNVVGENLELIEEPLTDSTKLIMNDNFALLKNELQKESRRLPSYAFKDYDLLNLQSFNEEAAEKINKYLDDLMAYQGKIFTKADNTKQKLINLLDEKKPGYTRNLRHNYHNEKLQDIVWNAYEKNSILRYKDNLIRQYRPIYHEPDNFEMFALRTHFYAPRKFVFGKYFDTFWVNVVIIWIMSILLYFPLYFDHLKKIINFAGNIKWSRILFWRRKK